MSSPIPEKYSSASSSDSPPSRTVITPICIASSTASSRPLKLIHRLAAERRLFAPAGRNRFRMDDPAKRNRLETYLDRHDLAVVWLARPASFAWLTGGSNVVVADDPVGVAAAGYDGDTISVVTDNIEADRLSDEELPTGTEIATFDWYESELRTAIGDRSPTPAAADIPMSGFERVDPAELRQPLTADEIDRYRQLGREVASAVETTCEAATGGVTERAFAADLTGVLADDGIRAPVVLVGNGDRTKRYRHFTPTDATIDDYALVSVTAERGGLHVSLTRWLAVDPPGGIHDRYEAIASVETAALAATQRVGSDGGTAADVFAAIQAAYDGIGHGAEWQNHHQGGAAGYAGREWIATPENQRSVRLPMAYAWNPTLPGMKSENTWLVTDDEMTCLTEGGWGTIDIATPNGSTALSHPVPFPSLT
jgi:Xaa-Pro aminopeptidase